jgi:Transposase DNA-binding/Transposase DDE domain
MAAVIWDPQTWAREEFGECKLGDSRRNERLMKLAQQVAAGPDGSTPNQTETWADLKGAYRLFDCDRVSFQNIIEPHCLRTRASCRPGDVKLIANDTTELDFGSSNEAEGLRPVGNGKGRGFFVHSGLMLDARTGQIEGMAGQEVFYRPPAGTKPLPRNVRRRSLERESVVWGKLMDRIGPPPAGVTWIHVCDRGADDYEVMHRAQRQGCQFVIRAAKLHRKIVDLEGNKLALEEWLQGLPPQGERQVAVKATSTTPARKATVVLRYGEAFLPEPRVLTPWLLEHRTGKLLRVGVVELREMAPPKGVQAVRWVLYFSEPVPDLATAELVIEHYEKRPIIEDYHKCYKTGCRVESRQYETAERLERVAGLLSMAAVRLLQLKTAAKETPDRPAAEVAPKAWVDMLSAIRKIPASQEMTVKTFVRQLAGLGGHMMRKCDGDPGWITLWRGYEKLQLMMRGAEAARKRCG